MLAPTKVMIKKLVIVIFIEKYLWLGGLIMLRLTFYLPENY